MADNCYWEKEYGAVEICSGEELPELVVGWTQFDTIPDNTGGRDSYDYGDFSDYPVTAKPAYGNGLIVVACMYFFGVQPVYSDGTAETQGIFVSDDDGFTYGPFIDKYPWLPGGNIPLGYDVSDIWQEHHQYNGTQISFDGANFFVVASSVMDIDREYVYIRTSKSADGVNWTTNSISGPNHYVTKSACLDGDLWYLGTNTHDYEYHAADPAYTTVGYSDNDGLTWTAFDLTFHEYQGSARPRDFDVDCSPNAEGLHIIVREWDDTDDGIYYYQPTSKSTWATRSVIFTFPPSWDYYANEGGMSIVASRVTPGNIYASVGGDGDTYNQVYFRKSGDSGASWGPVVPVPVLGLDGSFDIDWAWNGAQMVELDDGRLVIVAVYANVSNDPELAYSVSSDAGASFAAPVIFSTGEWIQDSTGYYSPRLHICAKGNDVVVTQCAREIAGNNLIFRP